MFFAIFGFFWKFIKTWVKNWVATAENIFFVVDVEELNDVLSSNGQTQVYEDDSDEINVQDCDGDKDRSIDKE